MNAVVVDSSALVALVLEEDDATRILRALHDTELRQISAFTLLETSLVVMSRKGPAGQAIFEALVERLRLDVVAMDREHAQVARQGWIRFGKGRHPAGLNIGDCCSYALAYLSGLPLLCKGDDFPKTDLSLAQY